ncbi:MAG: GNAT family N-acetyltransferase [Rickettsiales bacterium]|nr:GNAT family N-acetyltransferase [Rickettsiales bacterium]
MLNLEKHGTDLWKSIKDHNDIWQYLLNGPYEDQESFLSWLKDCENHKSRIYYTVIDKISKNALGVLCLIDSNLEHKTVEIGGIVFSPKLQKTTMASEAVFLLMNHVFENLKFRRLQWKCNNNNESSKKAARRFGFTFEGVHRHHMITKGKNRDTAFFSILDNEWPKIKSSFEKWLDPNNFDEKGHQKTKLLIL